MCAAAPLGNREPAPVSRFAADETQYSYGLATALCFSLAGCLDDNGETTESTGDTDAASTDDEANDDETDDENDGEEPDETDVEDLLETEEPELSLAFENEDREPVSAGMDIEITHRTEAFEWHRSFVGAPEEEENDEIVPGEGVVTFSVWGPGTVDITIEPNEVGDFEPVERDVEFTETEFEDAVHKELEIVLEGATPDSERERFRDDSEDEDD